MIVESIQDAKPIVLNEKSKNKKIGLMSTHSDIVHDGHRKVFNELRKSCDYLICERPPIAYISCPVEHDLLKYWGIPNSEPFIKKIRRKEGLNELVQLSDLFINNFNPYIPSTQIDEIKEFTKINYIDFRKKYQPSYLEDNKKLMVETLELVHFATTYYIIKNFFPIDVKVCCYKEGIRRFIEKKIYENSLEIKYIIIPPVRDKNNLCYGGEYFNLLEKDRNTLLKFLKGKMLIESRNETFESLQDRLYSIGWVVKNFEKYCGELLTGYPENSTYFHVQIASSTSTYFDSFLI